MVVGNLSPDYNVNPPFASQEKESSSLIPTVSVTKEGHLRFENVPVTWEELGNRLRNVSDLDKIKKEEEITSIELVKTVDILESLGKKKTNQILVGFALETDNELSNAKEKIKKKNLDAIILNSLTDKGAGFQHATNKITFIPAMGEHTAYPLKDKSEVAVDVLTQIKTMIDV